MKRCYNCEHAIQWAVGGEGWESGDVHAVCANRYGRFFKKTITRWYGSSKLRILQTGDVITDCDYWRFTQRSAGINVRIPKRMHGGKSYCRICNRVALDAKDSLCSPRCARDYYMLTDWKRIRCLIYVRDGGICMKCGKEVPISDFNVDHIIAKCNGGDEWDINNLELSCPQCNRKKGIKNDQEVHQVAMSQM